MSVTLNGHVYDISQFVGYGYLGTNADTGLVQFPNSIFTDMLAELAAAAAILSGGISPSTAGNTLVSDGALWRRSLDGAFPVKLQDLLFVNNAHTATAWIGSVDSAIGTRLSVVRAGGAAPRVQFFYANGTIAAPTIVTTGNSLGTFDWNGAQSSTVARLTARIDVVATQNWANDTAAGSQMLFSVTPNGTVGFTPALKLDQNLSATHYGNVLANTDNAFDIGASGASRFRDFFLSRNAAFGGTGRFGDNVTTTGTGAGFWMNAFGSFVTGIFETAASLHVRVNSTDRLVISTAGAFDFSGGSSANPISGISTAVIGTDPTGSEILRATSARFGSTASPKGSMGFSYTGTDFAFNLVGVGNVALWSNTRVLWNYQTNIEGHLLANTDATYDMGASGATRFRDLYLSRNIVAGGNITAIGAGATVLLIESTGAQNVVLNLRSGPGAVDPTINFYTGGSGTPSHTIDGNSGTFYFDFTSQTVWRKRSTSTTVMTVTDVGLLTILGPFLVTGGLSIKPPSVNKGSIIDAHVSQFTLNAGATAVVTDGGGGSDAGDVWVYDDVGGRGRFYVRNTGTTSTLIESQISAYGNAAGASNYNLYWSGGNLLLQNNTGSAHAFWIMKQGWFVNA